MVLKKHLDGGCFMVSCFPLETAATSGHLCPCSAQAEGGQSQHDPTLLGLGVKEAVFHILVQAALLTGHQKRSTSQPQMQPKLLESEGLLNSVPLDAQIVRPADQGCLS